LLATCYRLSGREGRVANMSAAIQLATRWRQLTDLLPISYRHHMEVTGKLVSWNLAFMLQLTTRIFRLEPAVNGQRNVNPRIYFEFEHATRGPLIKMPANRRTSFVF